MKHQQNTLEEIFGRLISFPTVTGDSRAMKACLDYVESVLQPAGMKIVRHMSNGFESLVATSRGTKNPSILLQAHMDVLPAPEEMFNLTKDSKNFYGRGTFDMKFAAACYLYSAQQLASKMKSLDFGIMLTSDEEKGGENGVLYLLEQGYRSKVCLLPDGAENWRIETTAKGAWHVRATAEGKSSHGSRPWEGDNSAERLVGFLAETTQLAPNQPHIGTSVVLSRLEAGEADNQVPAKASATLDIRTATMQDRMDVENQLRLLATKHQVELQTILNIDPIELDVNLDVVQEWERVVNEVRGQINGDYAMSFGASDARYFTQFGIPAIVTRPHGGGAHGNDEWIDQKGFRQFADCVKSYLLTSQGQNLTAKSTRSSIKRI